MAALADPSLFHGAVFDWFAEHGRPLNFRRTRDPYAVLVSETIAQQTQISRVEPAWQAFMERFPTLEALAAAPTADVIRAWQGLGYNRRALNLHRAAQIVVEEHGGRFPRDIEALMRLPGVGPYTARAIAAIAFGQRVGAVDTNVRRVLGRVVYGTASPGAADVQSGADSLVPEGRAAEWTHALMDIGALFCRPRDPRCERCPLSRHCAFASAAADSLIPRDIPRATERQRAVPFRLTSRWLRGRLVDRARAVEGGEWIRVDEAIGSHPAPEVSSAASTLAAEGLLELHASDPGLARLPQ